jgi:hypothetical protein
MPRRSIRKRFVPLKKSSNLKLLVRESCKQNTLPPTQTAFSMLQCAADLVIQSMDVGSEIEVFSNNRFWEACIDQVDSDGFSFSYAGMDDETGHVRFCDFLVTWRIPFDNTQTHLTHRNMVLMRDEI